MILPGVSSIFDDVIAGPPGIFYLQIGFGPRIVPANEALTWIDRAMDVVTAGGLQAAYDPIPDADAARLLADRYGVTGHLKRLATEKDDTFHVTADGAQYVLKIANGSEDPGEISLQNDLLQHIERVDPSLPVPRILSDVAGNVACNHMANDGSARIARLLTFLPGTPLDRTNSNARERVEIGKLCARLRKATAGFSHPAENRLLAWDIKHLGGLHPLLDEIADPDQHAKLKDGMERFLTIADKIPHLRMQVLHNDFSKSNLIVDHDRPEFVTGIIDFGDTVKTAIAIDLSTALLNQLPQTASVTMFDAPMDVLRGYLDHADITGEELALLPHLVLGRIVARALISITRAQRFPDNSVYILRNTAQGWHQLDWFLARSFDTITDTFSAFQNRATQP